MPSIIDQLLDAICPPPPEPKVKVVTVHNTVPDPWAGVNRAKDELRHCYVAFKRHKEEDTLHAVWDYWEHLGTEKFEDGEGVFREYILSRLDYIEKNGPRWLASKIRREFRKIGFDLDDDCFRDFPGEEIAAEGPAAG